LNERNIHPEDLSERSDEGPVIRIPLNFSIVSLVILMTAALMISILVPQYFEDDSLSGGEEEDPVLDVMLSSSIEEVEIEGERYENIPMLTAFEILLGIGDIPENRAGFDEGVKGIVDFIFGNGTNFRFEARTGIGWDDDTRSYEIETGPTVGSGIRYEKVKEVHLTDDDSSRTIIFSLSIMEGTNP
jgi:hypothetical protein